MLEDDHPGAWEQWMDFHQVRVSRFRRTELNDSSMLLEAAVRGHGFALARWSLALDELALGRLSLPFPKLAPVPTGLSYFLVAPRESYRRPELAAFRDWLREEAISLRLDQSKEPWQVQTTAWR